MKLPAQRELVRRFGASATTVAQALALLAQRGLVETRPGAGTFRSARPRPRTLGNISWQEAALEITEGLESSPGTARRFTAAGLASTLDTHGPDVVDLNGGYLHPSLQPVTLLGAALARVARRTEAWERPPAGGSPQLRDWFANDIGGGLSRSDILIAPGGQAALATTLRALTQPGDPVVLESPTYPGTIAASHAAGLRPVAGPLDDHGLIPEHLDDALARSRARVVVVQPLHQNPTGASMDRRRHALIRQIARDHNAFLVEDDFARHLTHADAPSIPPPMIADDPDGTVVHIRSLTKITSPNLRVAAIAARGPVANRLRAGLIIDTLLVPTALQQTALEVVTATGWRRTLGQLGTQLQHRRQIAVATLTRTGGPRRLAVHPHGGYHLWVGLPRHQDGASVARFALARGVAVTPGVNYYLPGDDHQPFLRLSYVAAPNTSDLETAIRRVTEIIDESHD